MAAKSAAKREGRRYSGQTMQARQAERRARLVEAAIHVAARAGLEGASVAAICAEAGLTARYFYESFPTRDAIFVEAFRVAQDELIARIAAAVEPQRPVASAVAGFYQALYDHPNLARVFLLDLDERGPQMRAASLEGGRKLAALFAPGTEDELRLAGVVGALVQIARRWIGFGFQRPVAEVAAIALPFTAPAGEGRDVGAPL